MNSVQLLEDNVNLPEISQLLGDAHDGNTRNVLFEMLHRKMRSDARGLMKGERADHTLQPTALVNEACLKLIAEGTIESSSNRRQLFFSAIRAMKQVLIDHARAKLTKKRGAGLAKQSLDIVLDNFESKHDVSFLDLESAMTRLKDSSPRAFEILNLRFFGGLTVPQVAELIGCSVGTVESDWRFARAKLLIWLRWG